MTELSFLLELLLEHELQKVTQTLIRERIKNIEIHPSVSARSPGFDIDPGIVKRPSRTSQAASTQRILEQMAEEQGMTPNQAETALQVATQVQTQTTPSVIAQTPAAAAAMQARATAISIAVSGKEERGRTSPRKF